MNRPPGYDTGEWLRNLMQQNVCYKITKEGKIIGGFIVIIDFPKTGHNYLGSIFVDPAYQNQGVGSQTLKFIEQKFPAKKWQTMTQEWAILNHHFYEKHGYKKKKEFFDDKEGHMTYVYEKTLQ